MRFHSAACAAVISAAAVSSASAFGFSPVAVPPRTIAQSSPKPHNHRLHPVAFLSSSSSRSFGMTSTTTTTTTATSAPSSSSTSLSLAAGGGPEALEEYAASFASISKSSKIQNPKLVKLAGAAALPLSYLAGAAMTPSRRLAARAIGGIVTAVAAGGVGKSAVEEDVRKGCPAAIARRLLELGLEDANVADGVERLREDYGVEEVDFVDMKTEVYGVYLQGMAKNPLLKTSEMKELTNLRNALRLTNQQLGQAHAEAAVKFFRDISRFASKEELADEDHPDRISLDKYLFLSERAFRQGGETEEAFTFEMSRIGKAFDGLTKEQCLERVENTAKPFYERALNSARSKLDSGAVNPEMLSRAKATLGLSDEVAHQMHIEEFAKEVRVQLGMPETDDEDDEEEDEFIEDEEGNLKLVEREVKDTSGIKFQEGAFERLSKLQEVLSLSDIEGDLEISSTVTEFWCNTALAVMNDAIAKTKSPDKAWSIIEKRQKELFLQDSSMKKLLTQITIQSLGTMLEKTRLFADVGNQAATVNGLNDLIEAKNICKEVLTHGGWKEFDDFEATIFDPNDTSSACGFLSPSVRYNMHRLYFYRSISKGDAGKKKVSDETMAKLQEVQKILGVPESEINFEYKQYFCPDLQKALTAATEEVAKGNATSALVDTYKAEIQQMKADYRLDNDMVVFYSAPLYNEALYKIAGKAPGGIPTKDDVNTLKCLQDLLDIDEVNAQRVASEVFADTYKKAIKEALGSTGIIAEEYRKPLDDLKDRLGMSEEECREIYVRAMSEKFKPMVEFISNEMERLVLTQDQLSQKRGIDYGEDYFKSGKSASGKLGLGTEGNIMRDIMNLIDFYTENDLIEKREVGTKKIEKKIPAEEEGGEEQTITEEVPVYENTYPITALSSGAITEQLAELCYRQFLVSSFTEQGPNAARYEASKGTWGGILGLSSAKMEEIGSNIGGMVYDNYITQMMGSKGALDQQDMMFLANVQAKLGITAEEGEDLMLKTQTKVLSEEASVLFGSEKEPSPETIKAFREKCNSLGLDLQNDIGISKARLVDLFQYEIGPGINSGDITNDDGDLIDEIRDSLGLAEEEGEEVIESIISTRSRGLLAEAKSFVLRGMAADAVARLKELVQYAAFVDGDLGLAPEKSDAQKMYFSFAASDFEGLDEETVEKQKVLLKTALGIPDVE
mmetsp:Transcript_21955/g.44861  ORF Transcript_21955/g.44861 Transcript_21955/m.44861 type:complete len:1186 (-) Transcript_21955:71-3628(-)